MRQLLFKSMKLLELQPRLQLLAELVPDGAKLADIGTDHGYLPVALLQREKIQRAIATDIGEEPLQHARRTAEECGLSEHVDFRLCDGLNGMMPDEADTIVIAGMGGETMIAILDAAPWAKENKTLLLQPMTKVELLRGWLGSNGYTFEKERLVWDKGNLYPIFIVRGGEKRELTTVEQYAGVAMDGDPLYGDYLAHQMSRLQKAIDGLNKANDCCSHGRACEFDEIRKALEEMRSKL